MQNISFCKLSILCKTSLLVLTVVSCSSTVLKCYIFSGGLSFYIDHCHQQCTQKQYFLWYYYYEVTDLNVAKQKTQMSLLLCRLVFSTCSLLDRNADKLLAVELKTWVGGITSLTLQVERRTQTALAWMFLCTWDWWQTKTNEKDMLWQRNCTILKRRVRSSLLIAQLSCFSFWRAAG